MADRAATISPCGRYRYTLSRELGGLMPGGTCVFVMLNPSTADADLDDPTIRRCMGFAKGWGHSRLEVVNLFAYRSTDPKAMALAESPIGPDNDAHLLRAAYGADRIICAWGAHGVHMQRSARVAGLLRAGGYQLQHLGLTKAGQPRHPLYLAGATQPEVWNV